MTILTRSDVLELEKAIFSTFAAQKSIRMANEFAKLIKFPGIPSVFSENIVLLAAHKLFPQYKHYNASLGGRVADIILSPPKGSAVSKGVTPIVKIEVKATANRGTLELKERDVQADVLVWVSFGNRFEGGRGPITVYVLSNPKESERVQKIAGRVAKLEHFIAAAQRSPGFAKHVCRRLSTLI